MSRGTFDAAAFYVALDAARESHKKTWKQVAREARISASTLTRMAQGKRPDVDSLAALVSWSGLRADDFIVRPEGAPSEPDSLTQIVGYLRADSHLSPRAADAIEQVLRATYDLVKGDSRDGQATTAKRVQD
jgi:transcriptional regulator with XRE-family HTH domain